jgi:hypothetical protein
MTRCSLRFQRTSPAVETTDVPSQTVTSVVIRVGEWHELAPEHDAYGLDLVVERDDDRAMCLAVVTGVALATLSRTEDPSYVDPFWVTLGHLAAERLRDEVVGGGVIPGEVFPNWHEADFAAAHDPDRYAPFQPGDAILSFEAPSNP